MQSWPRRDSLSLSEPFDRMGRMETEMFHLPMQREGAKTITVIAVVKIGM